MFRLKNIVLIRINNRLLMLDFPGRRNHLWNLLTVSLKSLETVYEIVWNLKILWFRLKSFAIPEILWNPIRRILVLRFLKIILFCITMCAKEKRWTCIYAFDTIGAYMWGVKKSIGSKQDFWNLEIIWNVQGFLNNCAIFENPRKFLKSCAISSNPIQ